MGNVGPTRSKRSSTPDSLATSRLMANGYCSLTSLLGTYVCTCPLSLISPQTSLLLVQLVRTGANRDSTRLEKSWRRNVSKRHAATTFAPSVPLVFLPLARVIAPPRFLQLVGAPLFMFSPAFVLFPRRPVTFLVPATPVRHAPLQALAYLGSGGVSHQSQSQTQNASW